MGRCLLVPKYSGLSSAQASASWLWESPVSLGIWRSRRRLRPPLPPATPCSSPSFAPCQQTLVLLLAATRRMVDSQSPAIPRLVRRSRVRRSRCPRRRSSCPQPVRHLRKRLVVPLEDTRAARRCRPRCSLNPHTASVARSRSRARLQHVQAARRVRRRQRRRPEGCARTGRRPLEPRTERRPSSCVGGGRKTQLLICLPLDGSCTALHPLGVTDSTRSAGRACVPVCVCAFNLRRSFRALLFGGAASRRPVCVCMCAYPPAGSGAAMGYRAPAWL